MVCGTTGLESSCYRLVTCHHRLQAKFISPSLRTTFPIPSEKGVCHSHLSACPPFCAVLILCSPANCTSLRNHTQLQPCWHLCSLARGVCRQEQSCLLNLPEAYSSQSFSHTQPRRPRPHAGPGLSHLQGKQRILPEVSKRDIQSLLLPTHTKILGCPEENTEKTQLPFRSLFFFKRGTTKSAPLQIIQTSHMFQCQLCPS